MCEDHISVVCCWSVLTICVANRQSICNSIGIKGSSVSLIRKGISCTKPVHKVGIMVSGTVMPPQMSYREARWVLHLRINWTLNSEDKILKCQIQVPFCFFFFKCFLKILIVILYVISHPHKIVETSRDLSNWQNLSTLLLQCWVLWNLFEVRFWMGCKFKLQKKDLLREIFCFEFYDLDALIYMEYDSYIFFT